MRHLTALLFSSIALSLSASKPPGDPNAFIGSFRMEMHTFKSGKEDKHSPLNLRYWSTADKLIYAMEMPGQPQQMRMLTDLRTNSSYTLIDDGRGNRTAMKTKRPEAAASAAKSEKSQVTVTKETRVIEGRTCTKVVAVSSEGTWTGWVDLSLKNAFTDMTRGMDGQAAQQSRQARADVDGFPLEFEYVPAKGDERIVGSIRELVIGKVDEALFDITGYQLIDMPGFAMPQR